MKINRGRALERLINFTDAIVAVAITLLVLSIVDIRGSDSDQTVWQVIADNSSVIITFTFTFIVVAMMWRVHTRVLSSLVAYDTVLFWLNLLWLFGIVVLPWMSALYGEGIAGNVRQWSGGEGLGGAGLLYWGTLAIISGVTGLINRHLRTHPELVEQRDPDYSIGRLRSILFTVAFTAIGVVSLFAPALSWWLPLGLFPLGIVLGRVDARAASATSP
jgi:uncharacterized membrane protein